MFRILFVFVISFICSTILSSQPKKFGKVSKENLNLSFSKADSNSNAVVLFDFAKYSIQKEFKYLVERHKRIKILSSRGIDHATYEIFYNPTKYDQDLEKVEAYTFNLNSKNKVEKKKLDKDDIFYEDNYGGWKVVRFTMPDAKEGSIIDIRYEIELGSAGQLPNWYFDSELPVKWSELVVEIPTFHRFDLISRVNKRPDIAEIEDKMVGIKYKYQSNSSTSYGGGGGQDLRMDAPAQRFRWVMKDNPALLYEPYVSSLENYRSYIFLQFKGVEIPNYNIKTEYNKSWEKIAKDLMDDEEYGKQIVSERWSQKLAEDLTDPNSTSSSKLKTIYQYVNSFSWNGSNNIYTNKDLRKVNEDKTGSSAELNLLLIKLLRELGFIADPILLSTRDNGRILKNYILPDQFNKTIVSVILDNQEIYLDAVNNTKFGILPISDLNGTALRIGEFNTDWVDLNSKEFSTTKVKIESELSPSGDITGNLNIDSEAYDAVRYTTTIQQDTLAFFQDFIPGHSKKLSVQTNAIEEGDYLEPRLTISASYSLNNLNVENDSLETIFLNPSGFDFLNLEQLESNKRRLPIEFPYRANRAIEYKVKIPDGYFVDEVPEDKTIVVPGEPFNYTESYIVRDNVLTIERNFIALKTDFKAEDHSKISSILSAVNTPSKTIVIKKSGK